MWMTCSRSSASSGTSDMVGAVSAPSMPDTFSVYVAMTASKGVSTRPCAKSASNGSGASSSIFFNTTILSISRRACFCRASSCSAVSGYPTKRKPRLGSRKVPGKGMIGSSSSSNSNPSGGSSPASFAVWTANCASWTSFACSWTMVMFSSTHKKRAISRVTVAVSNLPPESKDAFSSGSKGGPCEVSPGSVGSSMAAWMRSGTLTMSTP
mmetsp:Transcript_54380/g.145120  ORF Transcript_54380/g.145120 Transcript_54380/m.145120 type:complete len:210 (+) Transcript_54380:1024-1653(+)